MHEKKATASTPSTPAASPASWKALSKGTGKLPPRWVGGQGGQRRQDAGVEAMGRAEGGRKGERKDNGWQGGERKDT